MQSNNHTHIHAWHTGHTWSNTTKRPVAKETHEKGRVLVAIAAFFPPNQFPMPVEVTWVSLGGRGWDSLMHDRRKQKIQVA